MQQSEATGESIKSLADSILEALQAVQQIYSLEPAAHNLLELGPKLKRRVELH